MKFTFIERGIIGKDIFLHSFHSSVVGGKDDVGILAEFVAWPARIIGGFQISEQLTNVVIELLDHGTVERVGLSALAPFLWIFRQLHA